MSRQSRAIDSPLSCLPHTLDSVLAKELQMEVLLSHPYSLEEIGVLQGMGMSFYYEKIFSIEHFKCQILQIPEAFEDYLST